MNCDPNNRLTGVHPLLCEVMEKAYLRSSIKFKITEGMRALDKQKKLMEVGATRTMKSRHLIGQACDIVCLVDGEVRWDWPLYKQVADTVKQVAKELDVTITWGGDWKTFKDGPHFQIEGV